MLNIFVLLLAFASSQVQCIGSHDRILDPLMEILHVPTSVTVPVNNTTVHSPPSEFRVSMFFDPDAKKDLAYMTAVVPLCFAFNLPQRVDEYYTIYPETLSDLLLGIETPLYTSDVFPTIATNLSAWRIALPMNDTGTAKALLDSLTKSAPPFQRGDGGDGRYPVMRRNSPYRITSFQTDQEIAQYVRDTPYSIGIMNYPQSVEYRLPCSRVRIRRMRQSDVVLAPRIHEIDEPLYDMDVYEFSVGPLRPDMTIYPLLGPVVLHVSPNHTCNGDITLENFLYYLLQSSSVPDGLKHVAGIRIGPFELNTMLAKAQSKLCIKGRVIAAGGMDSTQEAFTAWTSLKYTERGTMVWIDQTGNSTENIEGVLSGKYRFSIVDLPPTKDQYNKRSTLRVLPFLGSTLSVVMNVGEKGVKLDVSRCTLTMIFNGTVKYWDDPLIQQENPSLLLSHVPIRLVVRKTSELNWIITRGLQAMDKKCNRGREQFSASMTWPFPTTSYTVFAQDEDEARSLITNTPYSLGFLMTATATEWQMSSFVFWDPDEDIHVDALVDVGNSIASSEMSKDTSEIIFDPSRATVYPFLGITYVVYDTNPQLDPADCVDQISVTSFFEFILQNDDANAIARRYGFSPVPLQVREKVIERLHREAQCDGKFIFPQPNNSQDATLRDAVIIVACVITAGVFAILFFRWYQRRAKVLHAPKDGSTKFTTMLIVLKKESQLWESHPQGMPAIAQRVDTIIKTCTKNSRCYRVKDIGSATLFTAKNSIDCVELADALVKRLSTVNWNEYLIADRVLNKSEAGTESEISHTSSEESRRRSSEFSRNSSSVSRRSSGLDLRKQTQSSIHSHPSFREPLTVAFGIGIHEDVGRILYNQEAHTYDYSGPSTDIAAVVTDTAQGHQVLISAAAKNSKFASHCGEEVFTTAHVGARDIPLHQYNPIGLPVQHFELPREDNVDSIAATMQQKSSGLATKRIVMMSMNLSQVDTKRPSEEVAASYKQQIEVLGNAVARNKGYVHSYVGGRVVVSFNAVYPTPQATKRAYLCVESVREGLPNVKVSCGMQYDSAMVGPFQMVLSGDTGSHNSNQRSNKKKAKKSVSSPVSVNSLFTPQEHHAVVTKAFEQAVCFHSRVTNEAAVVIPSTLEDEFSTFADYEFIDFVIPHGGSGSTVVGLLHVLHLKQTGEMDEWMYELEDKNQLSHQGNATEFVNQLFRKLIADQSSENFCVVKEMWLQVSKGVVEEGGVQKESQTTNVVLTRGGKTLQRMFSSYNSLLDYCRRDAN